MHGHTYGKSMDQLGKVKVANPARGQLDRKSQYFPVRAENLVSRDGFGSPVPRQPLMAILTLNLVLTCEISPSSAAASIYLFKNRHTPSGQSRVHRVTQQLRTDGVPNECCLGRLVTMDQNQYAPLFPTSTIGMKWACWKYRHLQGIGTTRSSSSRCVVGGSKIELALQKSTTNCSIVRADAEIIPRLSFCCTYVVGSNFCCHPQHIAKDCCG